MFGRRRDNGAPLDGNSEFAIPDYGNDPYGAVIPLDAHIRLANPGLRRLRPAGSCAAATTTTGASTSWATWTWGSSSRCYQQDIAAPVRGRADRLAGEPLVDYISPFGGGYFFALPGVANSSDYYGRTLLA